MVQVEIEGVVSRPPERDQGGAHRFAVEVIESYVNWYGRLRTWMTIYRIRAPDIEGNAPAVGDSVRIRGRLAHLVWRDRHGQRRVAIEVSADDVTLKSKGVNT